MSSPMRTRPVEEVIPKIEDDLAVGEDLEFQRRWWRFERLVWIGFALILALDLSGLLGRGPLANARDHTLDRSLNIEYQRYARFETPSILTIHFGPAASSKGQIQLWASESLIRGLGTERIIPAPASSKLDRGGVLYTWPAADQPDSVDFALSPANPGIERFTLRLPAFGDQLSEHVVVYP